MVVAVLSLQGAVIEHIQMLNKLGVGTFEIRKKADLDKHFDGLIIPGGESTVQGKLLHELDIYDTLKEKIEKGLPVFGTCAGLLLLAKSIDNDNKTHLGTMDITAMRNAYGRQLGSFYTNGSFDDKGEIPMTFIRAPYISSAGLWYQIFALFRSHLSLCLDIFNAASRAVNVFIHRNVLF